MNDNDIIKALECCKIKTPPYKCEECPLLRGMSNSCIYECKELAYDLINRQKAEIERLKAENSELRLKMSYMKEPNTIGDIHEMGAW